MIRICCNFKRTVNDRLRDDSDKFELPVTQILFHEIGRENKFFASLDLAKGYWQFSIKPEDRFKTSFTFENSTYCFNPLTPKRHSETRDFLNPQNEIEIINPDFSFKCVIEFAIIFLVMFLKI